MKQRTLKSLGWQTVDYNGHVAGYVLWSRTAGTWLHLNRVLHNEATCSGLIVCDHCTPTVLQSRASIQMWKCVTVQIFLQRKVIN
jgi:hypothetical protein